MNIEKLIDEHLTNKPKNSTRKRRDAEKILLDFIEYAEKTRKYADLGAYLDILIELRDLKMGAYDFEEGHTFTREDW